jgi:hypothetical protein
MTEELWSQLGTTTRRAIGRAKTRWGHPYRYEPRGNLLQRIATANQISIEEARQRLLNLRAEILKKQAEL